MTLSRDKINWVANKYSLAIFNLANKDKKIGAEMVLGDLRMILELQEKLPKFADILANPTVKPKNLLQIVGPILKALKLSKLTENFVHILIENRRAIYLAEITAALDKLVAKESGETFVEFTFANMIPEKRISELAAGFGKKIGKKIRPVTKINSDIIGGVIIKYESRMLDNSITNKFEQLNSQLKESVAAR